MDEAQEGSNADEHQHRNDGQRRERRDPGELGEPGRRPDQQRRDEGHEREGGQVEDPLEDDRAEDGCRAESLSARQQVGARRLAEARRQHGIAEVADQQDGEDAQHRRRAREQSLPAPAAEHHGSEQEPDGGDQRQHGCGGEGCDRGLEVDRLKDEVDRHGTGDQAESRKAQASHRIRRWGR
jgi:hypothetical protein